MNIEDKLRMAARNAVSQAKTAAPFVAEIARHYYQAFIEKGFDEEMALKLTLSAVKDAWITSH